MPLPGPVKSSTSHKPATRQGALLLPPLIPVAEHQRVLTTANDIPEQRPETPLPLTEVGISGKTAWVLLEGPETIRIPFQATLLVDLDPGRRGIHMSRLEQAISTLHDRSFPDLARYGQALCQQLLASQPATRATVRLNGTIPLVRPTPVSGHRSVDRAEALCTVFMEKGAPSAPRTRVTAGIGLHHLTACPCTQVYNEELFGPSAQPLSTHSQRSLTTLSITTADPDAPVAQEVLLRCLGSALHITHDLLKRPDEAELVLAAHCRPQFAEDTVRAVARSVAHELGGVLAPDSPVEIKSISQESIHIHDVHCRLETTLAEISSRLKAAEEKGSARPAL